MLCGGGMFHKPGCKDEMNFGEKNGGTQEPLLSAFNEESSSLCSYSLDLASEDYLFEYESNNTDFSETLQDEVIDLMNKNNNGTASCMEAQPGLEQSHSLYSNLPSETDFEKCSHKGNLSSSERAIVPVSPVSSGYGWKEYFQEQRLVLDSGFEEPSNIGEHHSENRIIHLGKEDCAADWNQDSKCSIKAKSQLHTLSQKAPEDQMLDSEGILTDTQEPLLDCIVRESLNNEVKTFLTKSSGSLVYEQSEKNNFYPEIVKRSVEIEAGDRPSQKKCVSEHEIETDFVLDADKNEKVSQMPCFIVASKRETNAQDRGNKGIVMPRSDSIFCFQVASLQDDIEKLKEANHCLSAYETILKMYQTKNVQLNKEKQQLKETVMHLNEDIKRLEQDKKSQQVQIMDMQYNTMALMSKLESGPSDEDLKKQLEKLREDYKLLQEKHKIEETEKNKVINECLEMDNTISKNEEELEGLRHANSKWEKDYKEAVLELQHLTGEKENVEKQLQTLQANLRHEVDLRMSEKEEYECKYALIVSQNKILKDNFENEQAEAENLKQYLDVVMKENVRLQQQAFENKDLNNQRLVEIDSWRQEFQKVSLLLEEKELDNNQSVLSLKSEISSMKQVLKKNEEEMRWRTHMLGRFLLDMRAIHSDLSVRVPQYETDCLNSTCVQRVTQLLSKIDSILSLTEGILVYQDTNTFFSREHKEIICALSEKIKALNNKKDALAKELQERRQYLASLRDIANENASSENVTEVTVLPDPEKSTSNLDLMAKTLERYVKEKGQCSKLVKKLEDDVDLKLQECTKLSGENSNLQRYANNLKCKVSSYEEIIQFADYRLERSSSHISELEKRNQYLEGLIKKFKMKSKKHRENRLEKHKMIPSLVQIEELQEINNGPSIICVKGQTSQQPSKSKPLELYEDRN